MNIRGCLSFWHPTRDCSFPFRGYAEFMPYASYIFGLLGGALIGLASLIASGATGKVPGISGVFSRALQTTTPDRLWRLVFLVGLVIGAGVTFLLSERAALYRPVGAWGFMVVAGLLVGIGARLAGGCTSGHGVCGIGMGSRDSILATIIFVGVGMLTVLALRHFLGGAS